MKNNQRFRDIEIRMEAAMLDIMKHTKFEKITVKKICEKAQGNSSAGWTVTAQVNRSTFYAHFMDIYDMVDKIEDLLNTELLEIYAAGPREEHLIFSEESMMYYFISFQARFTMILKHRVNTGWRKPEADVAAIIRNCIPAVLHKEKINIKYQLWNVTDSRRYKNADGYRIIV